MFQVGDVPFDEFKIRVATIKNGFDVAVGFVEGYIEALLDNVFVERRCLPQQVNSRLIANLLGSIGFFNGGFILMSFSVLTDTVNYDRIKTGISREGALSSVYSAVDKVGNAFGAAIFLVFLSLIGFVESSDGSLPQQSDEVLRWIALAYIVTPALLHSGSIFILNRYQLDESGQTQA